MNAYLVVGRRSVWVGESELQRLVELLPGTQLLVDVQTLRSNPECRRTARLTVTADQWERQAICTAAAKIREQHPRSAAALSMRELERLLRP